MCLPLATKRNKEQVTQTIRAWESLTSYWTNGACQTAAASALVQRLVADQRIEFSTLVWPFTCTREPK